MHSKGSTIPVKLNRRVLLRPIAMMTGDNLLDIRKATRDNRAEFGNLVKVYNGAVRAQMNRELGLQYKEQSMKVEHVRRQQQTMYKTMCQFVALKKKLLRDAYMKQQEQLTAAYGAVVQRSSRAVKLDILKPIQPADVGKPTAPGEYSENTDGNRGVADALTAPEAYSHYGLPKKCLVSLDAISNAVQLQPRNSVSGDNHASLLDKLEIDATSFEHLGSSSLPKAISATALTESSHVHVTGRSNVLTVTTTNAKKAFFTATISKLPVLPPIGEMSAGGKDHDRGGRSVAVATLLCGVTSAVYDSSTPHVASTDYIAAVGKANEKEKSDSCSSSLAETGTISAYGKSRSLAREIRLLRKEKERIRKQQLNSEQCPVYRQGSSGEFKAEQSDYTRKKFLAPSNYENYRRSKLLDDVKEAVRQQMKRADYFFSSLAVGDEKDEKPFKQQDADEKKIKERHRSATLRSKRTPATASDDSNMEKCTYVRRYVRPAERDRHWPSTTSWNQKE